MSMKSMFAMWALVMTALLTSAFAQNAKHGPDYEVPIIGKRQQYLGGSGCDAM
jgi:hypothetical protein